MKLLRLAALLLSLAAAAFAERPASSDAPDDTAPPDTVPGKRFTYKQSDGKPRDLEVYFPPGWDPAKNKAPGVIFFHGGAWTGGNLNQFRHACEYLAGRGLVAATADYRMLSKKDRAALPPGESYKRVCITDAKSAIRWMKQHAGELGVDPQRILAGGGSAGGHIAVLATTNPGLNDPGDPGEFDTGVVAYLLFNPAFQPDDSTDSEVDFAKHLKADLPPAILFFGDGDSLKSGGQAMVQQLKTLGNSKSELWFAEGQGHGFFNKPPWQDVTIAQADRFLVAHGFLKNPTPPTPPAGGEKLIQAP